MDALIDSLSANQKFILLILIVIATVAISIYGKFALKWGKNTLGIGSGTKENKKNDKKKDDKKLEDSKGKEIKIPVESETVYIKKRSCSDCVLILMGEREKYEMKIRGVIDRILRNQMVFVEQKLIELQTLFNNDFMEEYKIFKVESDIPLKYEMVQYKAFYGILIDSIAKVKDEIRRSFKENGFESLSGTEFSVYVKDKTKSIVALIIQNITNLYPVQGMIVPPDVASKKVEKTTSKIEDIIFEMFVHSKEVKRQADTDIKAYKSEYREWIDAFIN